MACLLLLQNDANVGEHLRRAIEAMPGMEVSTLSATLPNALRSLRSVPPDLVLLDLQVRRSDLEVFFEALCNQPRDTRPLLLVGALSLDDPMLMEAIAHGADGYYVHGGSPETLREAIVKVLAGESPMAPSIARQAKLRFEAPVWSGAGVGSDTLDALRLSDVQLRLLERIGEGYLVHEVARELLTTEHEVGLSIRTLYRKLQLDRRAAAMEAQAS